MLIFTLGQDRRDKTSARLEYLKERRIVVKRLNLCLAVAALGAAGACATAQAAHVGVFIGGGVPYYYPVAPVPYYYPPVYPPVVVAPPPPPINYVEQGPSEPAPPGPDAGGQPNASWYYCDASRSYYPYVKDCPAGWRAVAPQGAPSN
jgi:hypothetical protein